jgi:hypothetical protein
MESVDADLASSLVDHGERHDNASGVDGLLVNLQRDGGPLAR